MADRTAPWLITGYMLGIMQICRAVPGYDGGGAAREFRVGTALCLVSIFFASNYLVPCGAAECFAYLARVFPFPVRYTHAEPPAANPAQELRISNLLISIVLLTKEMNFELQPTDGLTARDERCALCGPPGGGVFPQLRKLVIIRLRLTKARALTESFGAEVRTKPRDNRQG